MSFLLNERLVKVSMFTGIIKTLGIVVGQAEKKGRTYLTVKAKNKINHVQEGDSISVSGVCLTVVHAAQSLLTFEIMPETKRKTILDKIKKNDWVNLETALRFGDPLGGHIVQGHIDTVATVKSVEKDAENVLISLNVPAGWGKYIILHGSIALDGISLTVARLRGNIVTVSLIKETLERTTWKNISVGQRVNVEVDVVGKYVEKLFKS